MYDEGIGPNNLTTWLAEHSRAEVDALLVCPEIHNDHPERERIRSLWQAAQEQEKGRRSWFWGRRRPYAEGRAAILARRACYQLATTQQTGETGGTIHHREGASGLR